MDTLSVGFGKLGLGVHGSNGGHKLRHGVQVRGKVVQHGDHVAGESCTRGPFLGQLAHLGLGGDVTGQQEPKETLRQRFGSCKQ